MKWYLELAAVFAGPLVVIAIGVWLNHRDRTTTAESKVADDADRLVLLADARDREDAMVAALDAIWEMPARKAAL